MMTNEIGSENAAIAPTGAKEKSGGNGDDPAAPPDLCMNCKTALVGSHCHVCGQKDTDFRRPVWSLGAEFADEVLSLHSRTAHTIVPLMFMPGVMSRRYADGQRARYVPPVRLFLIVLLIFFLVVNVSDVAIVQFKIADAPEPEGSGEAIDETDALADPEASGASSDETDTTSPAGGLKFRIYSDPDVQDLAEDEQEIIKSAQEESSDGDEVRLFGKPAGNIDVQFFVPIDTAANQPLMSAEELERLFEEQAAQQQDEASRQILGYAERMVFGLNRGAEDPRRLNQMFNNWIPRVMLILVPLFAILLRLFYWGRSRFLFNQLIFSLHTHTFLFVLLTALIGIVPLWGGNVGGWVFVTVAPLYLLIAMKLFFGQGWIRTITKFLAVGFIYMVMLSVVLLAMLPFALAEV